MSSNEPPEFGSFPLFLPEAMTVFENVTRKPPLPEALYHYTTADGLLGILKSKALWATNVRYMNDASEVEYGRELVATELSIALSRLKGTLTMFLAEFQKSLDRVLVTAEHYAACFCEVGDLLSQWRAYGSGGFALGFGAAALSRIPDASIVRIEYEPSVQRESVRNVTDHLNPLQTDREVA